MRRSPHLEWMRHNNFELGFGQFRHVVVDLLGRTLRRFIGGIFSLIGCKLRLTARRLSFPGARSSRVVPLRAVHWDEVLEAPRRQSEEGSMKVGIVGVGAVGSACLLSLVMRGCAREIVVIDKDRKRARGVVNDVQYGATLSPRVEICDGDYLDLAGASLVMITAGVNEKAGGATDRNDPSGRLRLLDTNADVYQEIVPKLLHATPAALILVVTDPPDPLADLVRMLGHDRVLSTGTFLDSLRFRFHLAQRLNVSPRSVDAQIVGEHGTSEVFLWSSARVGGRPVLEFLAQSAQQRDEFRRAVEHDVRYANIAIIEGIRASQFGIGMVSARIAEAVLRDERVVIPIGSYQSEFGVTLSVPSVLGRDGVTQRLAPEMSEQERQALHRSAETLKAAVGRIKIEKVTSTAGSSPSR
jgi:L-lactate dehydrogenase